MIYVKHFVNVKLYILQMYDICFYKEILYNLL